MGARYAWNKSNVEGNENAWLTEKIDHWEERYPAASGKKIYFCMNYFVRYDLANAKAIITPDTSQPYTQYTYSSGIKEFAVADGYTFCIISPTNRWDDENNKSVALTGEGQAFTKWMVNGNTDMSPPNAAIWTDKMPTKGLTRQVYYVGKGSYIGQVSGNANKYPSDGIQNGYYYEELGSDNIDPMAISYSSSEPKGGEEITVTLTPRSNTYGGTISYQYQYQAGSGEWTNIGNPTTATSVTVTVPKGAETFRVRAQASDDMGFTSGDYVTGATLNVQNLTADIGVSGKARALSKMYIGVNGKAREIGAAYIGVSGKARQLF